MTSIGGGKREWRIHHIDLDMVRTCKDEGIENKCTVDEVLEVNCKVMAKFDKHVRFTNLVSLPKQKQKSQHFLRMFLIISTLMVTSNATHALKEELYKIGH